MELIYTSESYCFGRKGKDSFLNHEGKQINNRCSLKECLFGVETLTWQHAARDEVAVFFGNVINRNWINGPFVQ